MAHPMARFMRVAPYRAVIDQSGISGGKQASSSPARVTEGTTWTTLHRPPYFREIGLARPSHQIKLTRRWDRESLIDGYIRRLLNSITCSIH